MKSALLLLFLSLLLFQAGCTIGGNPSGGGGGGLSTPPTASTPSGGIETMGPGTAHRVSLSDALKALPDAEQEGGVQLTGLSIVKVWGYGVDSSGLAKNWVLGMQGGGRTALLSYSEGQFREVDLPTTLPPEEVKIGEVLSPDDLFRKNLQTIAKEMNTLRVGEADLVLDAGTCQVIIHSPSESSTLTFNARTGELMASP